ncbi:MAG: uroporphyrinogen-III synthase, partial [Nitrospiraceae bacterium]
VTFVTGHEDPAKGVETLEWPRLAASHGTLVFLMGMKNLPTIVERLLAEGKSIETPVALIRWGTRSDQQTLVGTLKTIVAQAQAAALEPPTVIVVGEVVRLREQLNWFETKPLFGKRILVTRAKEQAGELTQLLRAYGADPVECPTIQIVSPDSWEELDGAVARLAQFQWLLFTSVNGIRPFMERLSGQGLDSRALSGIRIGCIGPRTAQELARYGLRADLIPSTFQAEGLVEALQASGVSGKRVLIPRAAVARELLPEQLRALGAEVSVVTAYQTVSPPADRAWLKELLRQGAIHTITFASSSTVRNFSQFFDSRQEMQSLTAGTAVACIGPITAQTAADMGIPATITADANTIPALVQAILKHSASPAMAAP